jgi:hypothetical protein
MYTRLGLILTLLCTSVALAQENFGTSTSNPGTSNPDLSGTWYMRGPINVGMPCKISQDGSTLNFVNEVGGKSAGKFVDSKTVIATDWENGLRGDISENGTRIDWANNSWWTR